MAIREEGKLYMIGLKSTLFLMGKFWILGVVVVEILFTLAARDIRLPLLMHHWKCVMK